MLPQAWQRVKAEKQGEIAALVKDGTLQAKGKGKSLRVELGPFYDWLGEPAPVEPEWARAYDIRPDDQEDVVKAHQFGRERTWKAYRWGPTVPIPYLPDLELDTGGPSRVDEVVAEHKKRMRSGVEEQWRLLGAVMRVVGEVAVEFDGEDPALPVLRHVLDHSREKLEGLHGETERYTGPFELPEPDDEEVALVREIAERQPPWS